MTTEIKNIYQRIVSIMGELDYIQKGSNKVNGQYRFVSHDQVTAKIHPLLVKHGVVVIPTVEEFSQDNNRTIVKLRVYFVNQDNSADAFYINTIGYGLDSSDKGPGKAISYAYKYALLKTFCLETGDDPDNDVESVYEPAKCLDFDLKIEPLLQDKDKEKLPKFLEFISKSTNKHVEDVKREALKRMDDFVNALHNWKSGK